MFTSRTSPLTVLLVSGALAALPAARCSGEAEHTDSVTARADTRVTIQPQETTKMAPKPDLPRPSIDPGRKSAEGRIRLGQDEWLKYDALTNTVTFELIGGPSGFAFNGYTSGGATLTVPSEANVVMNFVNKDGTPHSAEIMSGEGPLPNAAVDPAIPRAYTNQLLQGLPQEATDVMRFSVPKSGTYRIFCGVPGHGLSGMWIWMRVDPAAKTPSFGPTKG
ncbi:MAG: sulfocyanin-like copper-binding protein [Gemmatimonadales bacterium]